MIGGGFMGRAHALAYAISHCLPAPQVTARRQVVVDLTDQLAASAAASLLCGVGYRLADGRSARRRRLVDIVTPNDAHEPIALAAAGAGKHLLCEKALARDAEAAGRMWQHAGRPVWCTGAASTTVIRPPSPTHRQLLEQGRSARPTSSGLRICRIRG